MAHKTCKIGDTVLKSISLVENDVLRNAISDAFCSADAAASIQSAERVFNRLTSIPWSTETLRRFISGWRAMHGTAIYVSGLSVRIHRLAREASMDEQLHLFRAANEICEVIAEDTGVQDRPHGELFSEFATFVVGDDRWQLATYDVQECVRFRNYVKTQRLAAPIDVAILTTAASECWNTGEYTYLDSIILTWLTKSLRRPVDKLSEKLKYVSVHSGDTELGHFLHALAAWELFCQSQAIALDFDRVRAVFKEYISRIGTAFEELEHVLVE